MSKAKYVHNKKFNRIFWICALIQIHIYGIMLIKTHIILASDNILWEALGIQIVINYTLEEKIMFLHKYFEFATKIANIPEEDKDILKLFLEEIELSNIIAEHTTLRHIRLFIDELIRTSEMYSLYWIIKAIAKITIIVIIWAIMDQII
jgi:hypothetical protein